MNTQELYLTVLIPIYNEEKNIQSTIDLVSQKLLSLGCLFEILIVDDGSTDHSVSMVQEMRKAKSFIRLLQHKKNLGPGSGIITGLQESKGKFIIFIPADLAMNIDDLSKYMEASKNADVIIGIRDNKSDYTWFRKLVSKTNVFVLQTLFSLPYKDFNYIGMYKRDIFKTLHIESRSVFITGEIIIKAHQHGFKITEINTTYIPRKYGKASGSSLKSIVKTVMDITKFGLRHRFN